MVWYFVQLALDMAEMVKDHLQLCFPLFLFFFSWDHSDLKGDTKQIRESSREKLIEAFPWWSWEGKGDVQKRCCEAVARAVR